MKKIAAALTLWAAVSSQALAEDAVKADGSASPSEANPCAAYGEGYRPVNGGKTCIRIGGSIRYDMSVGGSDEDNNPRQN
jgi:opacity protein-like surface antigen